MPYAYHRLTKCWWLVFLRCPRWPRPLSHHRVAGNWKTPLPPALMGRPVCLMMMLRECQPAPRLPMTRVINCNPLPPAIAVPRGGPSPERAAPAWWPPLLWRRHGESAYIHVIGTEYIASRSFLSGYVGRFDFCFAIERFLRK